ncbi:MAG TPA: glycosyltransferase family 1 protein [Candidatus Binatia bacterium]|nr:glycosyltransferase family 1 protein [Candidatus Binatia bacterium]
MNTGNAPLRLGIDGRELREGVRTGIRRYVVEVVRAAVARGLVCVVYGDRGARLPPTSSAVRPVVLGGSWTQWWDQVALPRALRRDRVDVFLSPYYKRPLRTPCPAVITIHDLYFIGYPGRRRLLRDRVLTALARAYARGAAAIVADSEHSRQAIVTRLGLPAERVAVIPVGLGREFVATLPSPAQRDRYRLGPRYVLYVGNFLPHKNLPCLLRAWSALPPTIRGTHRLILAGGDRGGRPALEALARTLGVSAGVGFAGLVADEDLPAVYGGAAALVLPSLEEGFGLPALEAMACGAPVIASQRGALPEVVGDAGVLIDPERDDALTAALTRVLGDDAARAALARRGLARAATFTAERTAGRVIDLVQAVAGEAAALTRRAG